MFSRTEDFLSVVIPVYNEEKIAREFFEKLKGEIQHLCITYEIIAVNDGSHDHSHEILKSISDIIVIHNPYNLGYGASLKKGLKAARGNWILIMDSDGTYPVEKISDFLEYVNVYDMVVGNRNHKRDALGRKPAKWILKKLASFLVGRDIPDLNSGMRVFRRDLALEFFDLYPSGFSFTTTITIAFFVNDYTIQYIGIPYYKRVGDSNIRPWHFFDFMALVMKLILYFKPLKMLFIPIISLFSLGVAKAIKDIITIRSIGNLALILILFSFQILTMALVLKIITKKNLQ